ncbi:MAG TPA: hypothetical protein VK728_00835 [Candidatus Sulfotelmatobacter sp.]|jgi:hypothetical protein|nr:hypothetical protein [Candidatus Sulfotelmatobacter sp.]
MTKVKPELTLQEQLAIVDRKLASKRIKAMHVARLMAVRERLVKRMGRTQVSQQEDDALPSEFTGPQRRVLEGRSLLGKLNDEERELWEGVYRLENERLAQRQAQPKQDDVRPKPGMTNAEIKSFYAGVGQAAAPTPSTLEIIADVD